MKASRREVCLHSFLTSAADGSELSKSHPGRFTSENEPAVHLIGGERAPELSWKI
jgi:hypothetical protein